MNRPRLIWGGSGLALVLLFILSQSDRPNARTDVDILRAGDLSTDTALGPGQPVPLGPDAGALTNVAARRHGRAELGARPALGNGETRGFSSLEIEIQRDGLPYAHAQVALRNANDSAALDLPQLNVHGFVVRAGSTVFIDVTDNVTDWTQSTSTIAATEEGTQTVTVHLNPPQIDGEALLLLTSGSSGDPIAGAHVVSVCTDPPDYRESTTDVTGHVRVPRGPEFNYVITAAGFGGKELTTAHLKNEAFHRVELRPFARVFGQVHFVSSRAAAVDLVEIPQSETGSPRVIATTEVKRSGHWRFDAIMVPAGSETVGRVSVRLLLGTETRTLARGLTIEPGGELEVSDQWAMSAPVTLEFVYPSGLTVASRPKVWLERTIPAGEDGAAERKESLSASLDASGRVALSTLSPGDWLWRLKNTASGEVHVNRDPLIQVTLDGFEAIKGRVLVRDIGGAAIDTATAAQGVFVHSSSTAVPIRPSADGHFQLDFVAALCEHDLWAAWSAQPRDHKNQQQRVRAGTTGIVLHVTRGPSSIFVPQLNTISGPDAPKLGK